MYPFLVGWTTFPNRKKSKQNLWKMALSSFFWDRWKERNTVVFDNDNFSRERLKPSFITSLTSWACLIFASSSTLAPLFCLGGWYFFLCFFSFCFLFLVYSPYALGLGPVLLIYCSASLSKKKKKKDI